MHTNQLHARSGFSARLLAVLAVLSVAFTGCKDEENPITVTPAQTIVDVATGNSQLTLLTAAIARAGLANTLSGTGPFTVFAPTDAAFQAAGFANAAAVNTADPATLSRILLYHVVSGSAVAASAIPAGQTALPTAGTGNAPFYVNNAGGVVSVDGARVSQADVSASNGVIHLIDRLLMPPAGNVLAVVQADTSLSYLTAAAVRAGAAITGTLSGTAPVTLFAPTNAAFRAAGFKDVASINAAAAATLASVLTNHVVSSVRAYSPTLANGPVTTAGGGPVTVALGANNGVTLSSPGSATNAASVTAADISATNGVIHKISRVLLP